jgi:hypothetical protein
VSSSCPRGLALVLSWPAATRVAKLEYSFVRTTTERISHSVAPTPTSSASATIVRSTRTLCAYVRSASRFAASAWRSSWVCSCSVRVLSEVLNCATDDETVRSSSLGPLVASRNAREFAKVTNSPQAAWRLPATTPSGDDSGPETTSTSFRQAATSGNTT